VARGDYQFAAIPGSDRKPDRLTGKVALQAEGMYQIPARRDAVIASVGTFSELLEDVGELLLMPIVDEIATPPKKRDHFWQFADKPAVEGREPLDDATFSALIEALAQQTGLEITRETRPVSILFIDRQAKRAEAPVEEKSP
jgi:hypothetical protein